jgi:metal-dependent amidase/aminoacylase/carboxypeptidase family protein
LTNKRYAGRQDADRGDEGHSPPLVNESAIVERVSVPLKQLLGDKNVVNEFPAATGSEHAHLLRGDNVNLPIAFIAVGIADPTAFAQAPKEGKPVPFAAHNPNYKVDFAAVPLGAKIGTLPLLELMAK